MKIAIASDHGGFELKELIIRHLEEQGVDVNDMGCYDKSSCDYPVYGRAVAKAVADGSCEKGIVICTTGIGISITANKVKGIRCGIGYNDEVAKLLRNHNDANVIAFGAHYQNIDEIKKRVLTFISEPFLGERHQKRVDYIKNFEK